MWQLEVLGDFSGQLAEGCSALYLDPRPTYCVRLGLKAPASEKTRTTSVSLLPLLFISRI